jgi:predicted permease
MFTAITLITLAIGIGANTAIFSVIDGVLLKPLPYPHPEQLVGVGLNAPGINLSQFQMSPSTYFIYRDQNHTSQDIGLYHHDDLVNVTGGAQPEQVRALVVTDGTLPILGIRPMLGRWFNRSDDSPGSPETVMLTYGYWRRRFSGSTSIVGRTILVDGRTREVIGVMPEEFHFLDQVDAPLILPLQKDRSKTFLGNFDYFAIARLKPGVTLAEINADVARILPIVTRSFPPPPGFTVDEFQKLQLGPSVRPLKQDVIGNVGNALWVLVGAICIVMLIACANVANLLLVRVEGRRQELGIRAALGAGRRLVGDLLFESAILGLLGGVLGLGLAFGALHILIVMAPSGLPRVSEIGIHTPALLFNLAVSLLAGLLVGSVPVLRYTRTQLSTGLREGGRTLSQSRQQHRARNVLVVVQVAMALVLLVCSGLMIRTFRALMRIDPGFSGPAQVQTFRLSIPEADVSEPEPVVRMQEEISRRIAAIPGVSSVGLSSTIPMDGNIDREPVFAADRTYAEGEIPVTPRLKLVSPEFLSTLRIPLIVGRNFTWRDIYARIPVTLVSENMARKYWHNPVSALGKRIRLASNDDWHEVVGVVADVYDDGVDRDPALAVYCPILSNRFEGNDVEFQRSLSFAVRSTRTGSESLLQEVRQAVWSVDANLPLADVRTLDYFYMKSMSRPSFMLVMLGVSGAVGLLLGIVGLYSVIAYSVAQRRKEIGIRMALGAQRNELVRMFVRHGLVLTALGIACGLAAAAGLTRLMSSLLFHVNSLDPLTYCAVTLCLIATAMLASYLPSRRAATVDPVETLRAE